jgi:peptidoglycan/LPS O-acetylase OafA/YrhL
MSVGLSTELRPGIAAAPRSLAGAAAGVKSSRLPFVDAIRAVCSTLIACHHFSIYPPLADAAMPAVGPVIHWMQNYGRVAQMFFIVSGFMLAGSMSRRVWDSRVAGRYILQRYFRLAVPYLAASFAAMVACAIGRGWLDDRVIGSAPTAPQLIAHVFFLQNILGYENLSAGIWFVCINFQLTLLFVAALLVRDSLMGRGPEWLRMAMSKAPMVLGWLLAVASLFYFNRDDSWDAWAVYFFGQFFLGIVVHHALKNPRAQKWLAIYCLLMVAALAVEWRWRLVTGLVTALTLFIGGKAGVLSSWPTNRVLGFLGRTSYSLFLIHFPVLVVVATYWEMQGWTSSPLAATAGLVVAYVLSLGAAALFYRYVEGPATKLSRLFA